MPWTLPSLVLSCLGLVLGPASSFARTIEFESHLGTSMNVDVSPDGKTLVFDLLGKLYTLPTSGGEARLLLSGRSWDRSPRFSPDGREVSFISDREGVDSVWVFDRASRRLRRLTDGEGQFVAVAGIPQWLPDGHAIAYGHRGFGLMTLRVVPSGGGQSLPLIPEWKQPAGAPGVHGIGAYSAVFTPNQRRVFFAALGVVNSAEKLFEYSLYSFDLTSRTLSRLTESAADRDEFRPEVSRSGRLLAYVRSNGVDDTELRIRDLSDDSDRRLMPLPQAEPLTNDWSFSGAADQPAFAFTPDDRFLVLSYRGTLHRVSVADGTEHEISFTVRVKRQVAGAIKGHFRISDTPLKVRALRWPTVCPDGEVLAFSAVGSIWVSLGRDKPYRLTQSDDLEFMPACSPDSRSVAYVAFAHSRDQILAPGRLRITDLSSGETRDFPTKGSTDYLPSWSPDGRKLAVIREADTPEAPSAQFGWIDLATGAFQAVAQATPLTLADPGHSLGQHITFSEDGGSLYYEPDPYAAHRPGEIASAGPQHIRALHRVSLYGRGDQVLASASPDDVFGMFPSPDGSHVLFEGWNLEAYLAVLPGDGSSVWLSVPEDRESGIEDRKISEGGALYPAWIHDHQLSFAWINRIYRYRIGDRAPERVALVDLRVPRRGGHGVIAFTHATVITVSGRTGAGPVVRNATVVVRDRRIESIGPSDRMPIPPGASIVDAAGLTIMPGLIESHSHGLTPSQVGIPIGVENNTPAALAYGITTAWEATGSPDDSGLAERELREADRLVGQRWFGAGGILNHEGTLRYHSLSDVRAMVRKKTELGAQQCLKDREEAVRSAVQWYANAGREAGVCLVAHTEATPELLAMAADGAMIDHASLPEPVFDDVLEYLLGTGVTWTPNVLLVESLRTRPGSSFRSLFDEFVMGDKSQLNKFERFSRLAGTRRRSALEEVESAPQVLFAESAALREARTAARFAMRGGKVTVSSDGGMGIENHFEMWALQRGGMLTGDILRAATLNGAEKLGIQDDTGSLAAGKLADLLVLAANPLERIENSLSLKYVVLAGVIYDANTLEPVDLKRPSH